MIETGTGYTIGIHNVIDTQKFLFFGAYDGVVTLREFSDGTYSSISDVYQVTIAGSDVAKTVASNSYIIGARRSGYPAMVRFTYDATTITSEVGPDISTAFGHPGFAFDALEAIDSTNYVIVACTG